MIDGVVIALFLWLELGGIMHATVPTSMVFTYKNIVVRGYGGVLGIITLSNSRDEMSKKLISYTCMHEWHNHNEGIYHITYYPSLG